VPDRDPQHASTRGANYDPLPLFDQAVASRRLDTGHRVMKSWMEYCGRQGPMTNFLFTRDDRVKVKETGEVGTVEYGDTDTTTKVTFYQVRLDDGTTRPVAESHLLPVK
jgi:hypothetical protein